MDRNPDINMIKKTDYRMTTDGKVVDTILPLVSGCYFFFEAKHKYIANNAPTIGMNGRMRSPLFILRFFNLLEMLASNEINNIILKPK